MLAVCTVIVYSSRAGSQVERGYPLLIPQDGVEGTDTSSNDNNSTNTNNGGQQQQQGQQSNGTDGPKEGQMTY